jgi:hypothetical protein
MPHDIDDLNPYRAPLASMKPNEMESAETQTVRRRFRWRIIGVTVLYLYGGSLVLVAMLSTIHMAVWFAILLHRGELARFTWVVAVSTGAVVTLVLGIACIFAGRSLWKTHWALAMSTIAFAIGLYSAFVAIGGRLIGI